MSAKIMIVDDSGMARRILRAILEAAGYSVVEASEGMIALEAYVLETPDLVLLDLLMKGMSGLSVLSKLRELDRQVAVVVASADVQRSTREMVEAAGARGFIAKPFTSENVFQAVRAALEQGVSDNAAAE